jgi:hypothetical protein
VISRSKTFSRRTGALLMVGTMLGGISGPLLAQVAPAPPPQQPSNAAQAQPQAPSVAPSAATPGDALASPLANEASMFGPMTDVPALSLVIPVYNAADQLPATLEAVDQFASRYPSRRLRFRSRRTAASPSGTW